MESITLSAELVLPDGDCPGSSAESGRVNRSMAEEAESDTGGEKRKRRGEWLFRGKGRRGALGCVRWKE